jgi:hypothetical protein
MEIVIVLLFFFALYCLSNLVFANYVKEVTPLDKRLKKEEELRELRDERESNP